MKKVLFTLCFLFMFLAIVPVVHAATPMDDLINEIHAKLMHNYVVTETLESYDIVPRVYNIQSLVDYNDIINTSPNSMADLAGMTKLETDALLSELYLLRDDPSLTIMQAAAVDLDKEIAENLSERLGPVEGRITTGIAVLTAIEVTLGNLVAAQGELNDLLGQAEPVLSYAAATVDIIDSALSGFLYGATPDPIIRQCMFAYIYTGRAFGEGNPTNPEEYLFLNPLGIRQSLEYSANTLIDLYQQGTNDYSGATYGADQWMLDALLPGAPLEALHNGAEALSDAVNESVWIATGLAGQCDQYFSGQ